MQELDVAIYSHYDTVNDLNTALGDEFYPHEAPGVTDFPYGVFYQLFDSADRTFTENIELLQVQISVFSDQNSPAEINTLYGYVTDLFDDATISVVGYNVAYFKRLEGVRLRDKEMATWAYHVTYEVMLIQ